MNVVEIILSELNIRFSHTFVDRAFTNTPNSNNMYGIQRALSRYGVKTVGMHYENKGEAGVTFPCVLHLGGGFVVGIDLNNESIRYNDGKGIKEEDISKFNRKWTGDALLVCDTQHALEPDLFRNSIVDFYNSIVRYILIVVFVGLGLLTILKQGAATPISINVLLDIFGTMVCFLLFQKQLLEQTTFVDKVCSILQKGGCDYVLESKEAKLFGVVSWSEIGLAYFSSRILCLFIDAHCLSFLQLIGWVAMMYGVWSIWYQAFKAKHWCTLCVIVQAIVWATGIYNIFACKGLNLIMADVFSFAVCLIIVFVVIHVLADLNSAKENLNSVSKEFLAFKLQEDIMEVALQKTKVINVTEDDSSIFYGNKSAMITLTVLTNPHCAPCAQMHKRLMKLIKENHNVKIQYIYSSFSKELDDGCLFMIAIYQQKSYTEALRILDAWYQNGRMNAETFINRYNLDIHENKVQEEYAKHIAWKNRTGIQTTPSIIFSNHELSSYYSVEDFRDVL